MGCAGSLIEAEQSTIKSSPPEIAMPESPGRRKKRPIEGGEVTESGQQFIEMEIQFMRHLQESRFQPCRFVSTPLARSLIEKLKSDPAMSNNSFSDSIRSGNTDSKHSLVTRMKKRGLKESDLRSHSPGKYETFSDCSSSDDRALPENSFSLSLGKIMTPLLPISYEFSALEAAIYDSPEFVQPFAAKLPTMTDIEANHKYLTYCLPSPAPPGRIPPLFVAILAHSHNFMSALVDHFAPVMYSTAVREEIAKSLGTTTLSNEQCRLRLLALRRMMNFTFRTYTAIHLTYDMNSLGPEKARVHTNMLQSLCSDISRSDIFCRRDEADKRISRCMNMLQTVSLGYPIKYRIQNGVDFSSLHTVTLSELATNIERLDAPLDIIAFNEYRQRLKVLRKELTIEEIENLLHSVERPAPNDEAAEKNMGGNQYTGDSEMFSKENNSFCSADITSLNNDAEANVAKEDAVADLAKPELKVNVDDSDVSPRKSAADAFRTIFSSLAPSLRDVRVPEIWSAEELDRNLRFHIAMTRTLPKKNIRLPTLLSELFPMIRTVFGLGDPDPFVEPVQLRRRARSKGALGESVSSSFGRRCTVDPTAAASVKPLPKDYQGNLLHILIVTGRFERFCRVLGVLKKYDDIDGRTERQEETGIFENCAPLRDFLSATDCRGNNVLHLAAQRATSHADDAYLEHLRLNYTDICSNLVYMTNNDSLRPGERPLHNNYSLMNSQVNSEEDEPESPGELDLNLILSFRGEGHRLHQSFDFMPSSEMAAAAATAAILEKPDGELAAISPPVDKPQGEDAMEPELFTQPELTNHKQHSRQVISLGSIEPILPSKENSHTPEETKTTDDSMEKDCLENSSNTSSKVVSRLYRFHDHERIDALKHPSECPDALTTKSLGSSKRSASGVVSNDSMCPMDAIVAADAEASPGPDPAAPADAAVRKSLVTPKRGEDSIIALLPPTLDTPPIGPESPVGSLGLLRLKQASAEARTPKLTDEEKQVMLEFMPTAGQEDDAKGGPVSPVMLCGASQTRFSSVRQTVEGDNLESSCRSSTWITRTAAHKNLTQDQRVFLRLQEENEIEVDIPENSALFNAALVSPNAKPMTAPTGLKESFSSLPPALI